MDSLRVGMYPVTLRQQIEETLAPTVSTAGLCRRSEHRLAGIQTI